MLININVAPGELLDKITILQIKLERIENVEKLKNVRYELADLMKTFEKEIPKSEMLEDLLRGLKEVNEKLWVIEDEIRDCERIKDFGPNFVRLAQSVYKLNDQRFFVKSEINKLLNASIREEKSYKHY